LLFQSGNTVFQELDLGGSPAPIFRDAIKPIADFLNLTAYFLDFASHVVQRRFIVSDLGTQSITLSAHRLDVFLGSTAVRPEEGEEGYKRYNEEIAHWSVVSADLS